MHVAHLRQPMAGRRAILTTKTAMMRVRVGGGLKRRRLGVVAEQAFLAAI
jgi:hypothetical protein